MGRKGASVGKTMLYIALLVVLFTLAYSCAR